MTKDDAIQAKIKAQNAIRELDSIVADIRGRYADEEFKAVRRAVGNCLAVIINEILDRIYKEYPELEDMQADEPA